MRVESNASRARLLALQIGAVLDDFGQGWGIQLQMSATPRRPYPTLRPRKGPAPAQPTNAQVAVYLQRMGRDFFVVTDAMRASMVAQLRARFGERAIPSSSQVMMAVGPMYKRWVVDRVLHEGADVSGSIPANTPKWTTYKAALGLSTQRLRASGQLASALETSRPVMVRLGG